MAQESMEHAAADLEKFSHKSFQQQFDPDVIIPDKISRKLVYSSHLLLVTAAMALVRRRWDLAIILVLVYITSVMHWKAPRFSSPWRVADYVAVAGAVGYGSYVAITLAADSPGLCAIWYAGMAVVAAVFIVNEQLYYYGTLRTVSGEAYELAFAFEGMVGEADADETAVDDVEANVVTTLSLDEKNNSSDSNSNIAESSPDLVDTEEMQRRELRRQAALEARRQAQHFLCIRAPPTKPGTDDRTALYQRTVLVHMLCVHVLANVLALVVVVLMSESATERWKE